MNSNNNLLAQPLINPRKSAAGSMRRDMYLPPPKFVPEKTVYKENFYYIDGKTPTLIKINFRQGCLTLRPSANKESKKKFL